MTNQVHLNIPRGYPVTKETAEKIYTGLREKNWWKQLYDGKYHHLGPRVFDERLHRKVAEPGYYESALKAFEFAKRHLTEKISVEFYCNLHKEACAHFKGVENNTEMKADDAGQFRIVRVGCRDKIDEVLNLCSPNDERRKKLIGEFAELREHYGDNVAEAFKKQSAMGDSMSVIVKSKSITLEEVQEIENLVQNKVRALKDTLGSMKQDPVLKNAAPRVELKGRLLHINYVVPECVWIEKVIAHLFETFNQNLAQIDEEIVSSGHDETDGLIQKKLVLIDDLYQKLEWVHPFTDGQGRTDLLLLAKLLSENGFTPAILDEPYMSSYSSRDEWVAYQKEGMQKWEEEREKACNIII